MKELTSEQKSRLINIQNELTLLSNELNGEDENINKQIDVLQNELKNIKEKTNIKNKVDNNKKINEDNNYYLDKNNEIKSRILDLINNSDNDYIIQDYLLNQSEQRKLNSPDNYLYYILLIINSIFKGEKKLYKKSLSNALNLNKDNTHILLALICLKINDIEKAYDWFVKYLDEINPKNISPVIIDVLNYVLLNLEGSKIEDLFFEKFNLWFSNDLYDTNVINYQKSKIEKMIQNENNIDDDFIYLKEYVEGYSNIIDTLDFSFKYRNFLLNMTSFNENNNLITISSIIDKIINGKDIKNNLIYISTDAFFDNNISSYTKSFIFDFIKDDIKNNINDIYNESFNNVNEYKITINQWKGTTNNGSNEKQLQESISKYACEPFKEIESKEHFFSIKTVYCLAFILSGIIVGMFVLYIGIIVVIVGTIMFFLFINETKTNIKNITLEKNIEIDKYTYELNNLLSEIVDINNEINENINISNNIINNL